MSITRIEAYDPTDMSLLSSDISELNFGGVIRGRFCSQAAVIKPITEGTLTALALFLEDNGGYDHARFSYFNSNNWVSDIIPGDAHMSDAFTVNPGVSDMTTSDRGANLDPVDPGFIWLDVNIGLGSTIGTGTANYRFVFEYN